MNIGATRIANGPSGLSRRSPLSPALALAALCAGLTGLSGLALATEYSRDLGQASLNKQGHAASRFSTRSGSAGGTSDQIRRLGDLRRRAEERAATGSRQATPSNGTALGDDRATVEIKDAGPTTKLRDRGRAAAGARVGDRATVEPRNDIRAATRSSGQTAPRGAVRESLRQRVPQDLSALVRRPGTGKTVEASRELYPLDAGRDYVSKGVRGAVPEGRPRVGEGTSRAGQKLPQIGRARGIEGAGPGDDLRYPRNLRPEPSPELTRPQPRQPHLNPRPGNAQQARQATQGQGGGAGRPNPNPPEPDLGPQPLPNPGQIVPRDENDEQNNADDANDDANDDGGQNNGQQMAGNGEGPPPGYRAVTPPPNCFGNICINQPTYFVPIEN